MKDKKKSIWIISGIAFLLIVGILCYKFFSDKYKLTRNEKNWISDNLSNVQNINIINNATVFGDNGTGVFYDFLKDFQTEYRLEINPITFKKGDEVNNLAFNAGNQITDDDIVFYTDHYAIIGKERKIHQSIYDFSSMQIGVLSSDLDYLKSSLPGFTFNAYDSSEKLFEGLKNNEVSFVLTSIIDNIDYIFQNDYAINYHLSDVKYYYYFTGNKDNILASIIKKYFHRWEDKYLDSVFNSNELIAVSSALGITDADLNDLVNRSYKYGLINQNPYEVITGGNFGGISAVYLKKFSDFSGIDFNFKKYHSLNSFKDAIKNGKVDIYLNYYTFNNSLEDIYNYENISFDIIAPAKTGLVYNTLLSLKDEEVYVQKDSKIAKYLKENASANINYYETIRDMLKLARKGKIIALDSRVFDYFHKNKLKNYESRLLINIDDSYTFRVKNYPSLNKLIGAYTSMLDPKAIAYEGIYNHNRTIFKGELLGKIAQYFISILAIIFAALLIVYRRSKKVTIAKKINNSEKIKYIDLLTSLKNRNYLSENIELWNNNKIYPQAMIVIDLNNIAFLNDRKGYEAGDRQIAAMANILIKTQLDNSDIMRTNGNEFLVYLVGYQQKHIVNYIHKLTKEMKKLPYEYGAAIGYSMITDDIKSIEDAINEALDEMKKQKAKSKEV